MEWTSDAEHAIKKVPFFVRKRVKARVEKEALASGKTIVSLTEVNTTQKRYLNNMNSEIKGFQLDACFGANGCPNRAADSGELLQNVERLLEKENLLEFLKRHVSGDIKFHHEFRITLSDCPNACSQPQIKDIGIIGAITPVITDEPCTLCKACLDVCKENAVTISSEQELPKIDHYLCLDCGQCVDICPTGTLEEGKKGFKVLLGGKLGRHPVLATELPGIFTDDEVLEIVKNAITFYKKYSKNGERFSELFQRHDFTKFMNRQVE